MFDSRAYIESQNPSRLITRLCKHWSHKFPVNFSEVEGHIELSVGQCTLRVADGGLDIQLTTTDAQSMQRLQQVVADHLQRMATNERFNFDWSN